ncbi:hypothetical protein HPC49_13470 [Pyxidicoccus fallax]|uniref:Uncharacterized protein n=1 Tax=Pyxidicoccus fallax TaxID=394095 RepID=A0A848LHX9_9BACT|nr:hypothetical protein [Pyxidicoccus fallax]NMO16678.1 hypothetical protein [Pyxidicoccus fallax]NPC79243.1 hypothetical protein [Pyxidicoccus fallax]
MTVIELLVILFWVACIGGSASLMQSHFGWVGVFPGALLGALVPFVLYRAMGWGERLYRVASGLRRARGKPMTLSDIEDALPWGLHDARLTWMWVDWGRGKLSLHVRVKMDEHQKTDQLAGITLSGLRYFTMTPPTGSAPEGAPDPERGSWIDAGSGHARPEAAASHPPTPEGHFVHYIYFRDTGQDLHVCAQEAELTWIEEKPVPVSGSGALFPGEEIPDPKPGSR